MTAGSYCYIGPQGIVHGTVVSGGPRGRGAGDGDPARVVTPPPPPQLTVLNAGRRYLGLQDLAGKVFITSGLGGMSGAQAKAAVIVGCIGVIAEVSPQGQPPAPSRAPLLPLPSLLLPLPSHPSKADSPAFQVPITAGPGATLPGPMPPGPGLPCLGALRSSREMVNL